MSNFVLSDLEVKLTGRKASRPMAGGKIQELVEVTPTDDSNGTWKKWVPRATLFEIQEPNAIPPK
jgi:hypothetical protein